MFHWETPLTPLLVVDITPSWEFMQFYTLYLDPPQGVSVLQ